MTDTLRFCEAERPWLLETIEALVRLESPSTDKAAVDRCGAELARRLTAAGGRVERVPQVERGDHVRAVFPGGPTQVLVLGHYDTVWPVGQIERMPLVERDGRLHGPGIFDMKSGIAVAILAARAMRGTPRATPPTIVMLWTTDEEIGSATSRALIEREARASRKGCGEFELVVHGISAHAGLDPGTGASAIHELARQIIAIEAIQDLPRGISVNVGVIAGGSRANVVAAEARATIDVRVPAMADVARVESALAGLSPELRGTRLELRGGVDRPPLERSDRVVRLYELAKGIAADLGRTLGEGGAGGGSDGNFTAAAGVPTLDGLGPAGDGAHAAHEHVIVDDLAWRAALVCELIARVGAEQKD